MIKKICFLLILTFAGFVSAAEDTCEKVVLITGASGDIGFAVAQHYVDQKQAVICQYWNNKEKLEELKKSSPERVHLIRADFSNPESIDEFWKASLAWKNTINIVINSAGVELEDSDLKQMTSTMNINFMSPRLVCDRAIKHYRSKEVTEGARGIIVNLGSRAAFRGMPEGYYTYAASKAALTTYSQDIARDNAAKGIYVYVVAPGPVEGKMFTGLKEDVKAQCLDSMPTKKPVKLQEVVGMIDFYASGKVPSATGGVFDLMGASYRH